MHAPGLPFRHGVDGARAQSSPSVAARSPRETVESVVERTNTPRAGAVEAEKVLVPKNADRDPGL